MAERRGRVVVLSGGSSAGKTTLGRRLQAELPGWWLLLGVDTFLGTLPAHGFQHEDGIVFGDDGTITRGPRFMALYRAWQRAVAAMVAAGADVMLDEVLLDGGADQQTWDDALDGLDVCWIGIRCDPDIAAAREAARGDRSFGLARRQADTVHVGVRYDVEVDVGVLDQPEAAAVIVAELGRRWPVDAVR